MPGAHSTGCLVPLNQSRLPGTPRANAPSALPTGTGRRAGTGPSGSHAAVAGARGILSWRSRAELAPLAARRAAVPRVLCVHRRRLFALQAGPHPERALHPHLRAGLRDAAGRDTAGHGLQHQEVPARPGPASLHVAGGGSGCCVALSAPLLPVPIPGTCCSRCICARETGRCCGSSREGSKGVQVSSDGAASPHIPPSAPQAPPDCPAGQLGSDTVPGSARPHGPRLGPVRLHRLPT